ncbi:MAG TPA: uracil-DNA glycosylase family protein [Burkholderiales bacterium]|nr:uracil-DNA glycosylase family protein [Burkholderiales bacterium]
MSARAAIAAGRPPRGSLASLLADVRGCTLCAAHLPLGPRPVLQVHARARILIAAQAPGRKVHASGLPFDDASGDRLRDWLGIPRETFYDATRVAILPMGFCFPGSGRSGDLPPRPECAPAWRAALLAHLKHLELTLVVGRHAQAYHLGGTVPLTQAVRAWRAHWPRMLLLPHPSPRNNGWLKHNPWFAREILPGLRARVAEIVARAER